MRIAGRRCCFGLGVAVDGFSVRGLEWYVGGVLRAGDLDGGVVCSGGVIGVLGIEHVFDALANLALSRCELRQRLFLLLLFLTHVLVSDGLPSDKKNE